METNGRLAENEQFGKYRIVRLMGEGGMGAVYEAIHPALKKRFAIKTLLPAVAAQRDARTRFLREAEAASRINHPIGQMSPNWNSYAQAPDYRA